MKQFTFNKTAVFAVFNEVVNSSVSFADRLLTLGIASRADAKPLAMEWAANKHGVKIVQGQRGATLPRDSAASRAANRVLAVCFPTADMPMPKAKAGSNNKTDPVARLVKAYANLSGAEKRRFLSQLGK